MAGEQAPNNNNPPGSGVGLDAELDEVVESQAALAYVVLLSGQQAQRIFTVKRTSVVLGRGEDADIQLPDGSVSQHHARIARQGKNFDVTDLDSTNGTFIRGKRVARATLRNADRITLGTVDLMFLLDRPTNATIQIPDAFARIPVATAMPSALVPARLPIISPEYAGLGAPPPTDAEPTLADVIRKLVQIYDFVRARAVFIIVFAMIGVAGGMTSLFVSPPGVSAIAEVKLLPHISLTTPSPDDRYQSMDQDSPSFVKSAEHALTQREFVRSELIKFGEPDPPEGRIKSVAGKLKVEEVGDHVFRATYKDVVSARPAPLPLLSSMLQDYVQGEVGKSLREMAAKVDFLRDQLKSVETDLAKIGNERAAFREANADRLPEDSVQTHSSRFDLETRRAELSGQVRQLQAELTAEQEQLRTNRPEAQRKFQRSETYRQSLTEINRKLSEAYSRGLGEAHPEVQQLKQEQKRLEALASDELQASTPTLSRESDPNYQQGQSRIEKLQAQLGATKASLSDTEQSLGAVRSVVKDLPRIEQRLSELDHRKDATQALHGDLFSKLKQAEIQLNLEKVSAESRYDFSPARLERPRKSSTLLLRCGLGLLLGVFVGFAGIALQEAKRVFTQTMAAQTLIRPSSNSRPRNSRF
jgi:uncharacterized protein involved in exopolysaccharide biosynthesis